MAAPLPSPFRPRRRREQARALAILAAVAVHVALIGLLLFGRSPPDTLQPPLVDLQIAPPPFTPPARVQAHRAGGSPASAAKHAPAATPRPRLALVPPETVRPPAPVPPLPLPAPTLIAPIGPVLASPVTGAGAGAATGGSGAGLGTGPGGPGGPALADPDWIVWPDADIITAHYPRHAWETGLTGEAVLRCRGTIDGRARDCRVASETPSGEGFGRAGLSLARYFRFRPLMLNGRAVEATLRIPIDFSVGGEGG